MAVNPAWSHTQAVRWIRTVDQRDFIRVIGDGDFPLVASDQYEIELLDTTYFLPRWNQSGTQFTVLIIQNTSPAAVTGSVIFYDAAGGLLETVPFDVPFRGVKVIQGGALPSLAQNSGSAAIVHDGGYGALAAKAVALEPATGFTFDTLIVPVPR